jgi:hypothetical protein
MKKITLIVSILVFMFTACSDKKTRKQLIIPYHSQETLIWQDGGN